MKLKRLLEFKVMKKTILPLLFLLLATTLSAQKFTKAEKALIQSGDTKAMMKVIQITDQNELKILKTVS
jgi:peptide deformylase